MCGSGTYAEWLTLSRSGSVVAPITVASFPGERATITGRLKITGSYVRVSGLRFVGGTSANASDVLVYVSGGDSVEVSGSELTGAAMSAVYVGDPGNGADAFRFVSNWVHDNGSHYNLDHGIYCGTARGALIANNLFERSYAYGIHLYPDCDGGGDAEHGGCERPFGDHRRRSRRRQMGMVVVNNVVAFNADYGVRRTGWADRIGERDPGQPLLRESRRRSRLRLGRARVVVRRQPGG
jgi:hypothetical protein